MTAEPVPRYPFDRTEALQPPREGAQLQSGCPVAHVQLPSGDTAELVTRHDDVRTLLTDPRFSRGGAEAARVSTTADGGIFARGMASGSMIAGTGHRRWRRLLTPSFTIRKIEAWGPGGQRVGEGPVGGVLAAG